MKFTAKQELARDLLASAAQHVMLFGGSRSGKTFILVYAVIFRALKAPFSRHAILRFRFNHVKASIVLDTFPKVMELCFPDVKGTMNKSDWYYQFPNGAQIWFGGLDDKERSEKVLGQEHCTIYLNECSQIPNSSREIAITRLAQMVTQKVKNRADKPLPLKMYYDCNPPSQAHWSYKIFVQHRDPETKKPILDPKNYVSLQINPGDNVDNLPGNYIKTLESLGSRLRKRFLDGIFADDNPSALFNSADIDKWRVIDGTVPDLVRIVIGVDPSGSGDIDNADNDAIGIVAGGLGIDGNAYLLEDNTLKAGPGTWGKMATGTFDRLEGDVIVGEANFGGAMVQHVIQTARPRTNYKSVTASRGKVVRAEPFSALYEQGKIRHVGHFAELEDELTAFSTAGYTGELSPNRVDAWIWVLAELFPALIKVKKEEKIQPYIATGSAYSL